MPHDYVSLRELSNRLGLSPRTIRAWVRDPVHPLPAYRVGGKLLFKWAEVERWLEEFRVTPLNTNELAAQFATELLNKE